MSKFSTVLIAGALLTVLIAPAEAAKPKTVWEDPSGDADGAQGLGSSIPGGWDLVKGSIVKKKANLEFTVEHADMPPIGSGPEATRFLWAFTVDGKTYRFTVKSVDIGKPDIPAGQTTERVGRVDVEGHFRLEDGECTETSAGVTFVNCAPLEYLDGTFDAAAMSFTIVLPMKAVKAKVGSVIGPGSNTICNLCWVSHVAERSSNAVIIDQAAQTATYKVPKK